MAVGEKIIGDGAMAFGGAVAVAVEVVGGGGPCRGGIDEELGAVSDENRLGRMGDGGGAEPAGVFESPGASTVVHSTYVHVQVHAIAGGTDIVLG